MKTKLKHLLAALTFLGIAVWNATAAVPSAPQNLTPSWLVNYWPVGSESLLWWEPVPEAASYTVYQFDETSSTWEIAASGVTEPHYRNLLPPAPPARYVVTASNGDGESAPSNEAIIEGNMFNFTITGDWPEYSSWSEGVTPTNAWLSWWVNITSGADGLVELSTNGTDFTTVMQNTNYQGWHSVLMTNLTPLTFYHYRVTSVGTNRGGLTLTRWFATEDTNHPPVVHGLSVTTLLGMPTSISLAGNDSAGTPPYVSIQSFRIVQGPTNGTLSETTIWAGDNTASVTYTPSVNRPFEDQFWYVANDGDLDSAPALVTITNIYFNRPPETGQVVASTLEGTPVAIELISSDPDGDVLTFSLDTNYVALGTITGTNSSLIYTPPPGYTGGDSFGYWVSDGTLTASGVVLIEILSTNSPPTINSQSLTVLEDASQSITLTGSDVNGNPLTFRITTPPAHGSLSGTPPSFVYQPASDYHGADSLSFVANDGLADSLPGTVSLTITPVNDAPIASDVVQVLNEDSSVIVVFQGIDPDGGTPVPVIVVHPQHGSLIPYYAAPMRIVYRPATNYFGSDTFTYALTDSALTGNVATVTLQVNPLPDAPIAHPQTISAMEDTAIPITLTAVDSDGDPLSYQAINPPAHGILTGVPPNLVYSPFPNYNGPDSFQFRASDGTTSSAATQITITVTPQNDRPTATSLSLTTPEDSPLLTQLTATDLDGDALTYTLNTSPAHGTLAGAGRDWTYTPAGNFNGSDVFTFRAADTAGLSSTGTVAITITAVNDAPTANDQVLTLTEDGTLNLTLAGADLDGDTLNYVINNSGPTNGTLSGTVTNLVYTPPVNFNGWDGFTFHVHDGTATGNTATVYLRILRDNDPPIAHNQSVTTAEDTALTIITTGDDVDGDSLLHVIVSNPTGGSLTGGGGTWNYQPSLNFNGTDSFTFRVMDTYGVSATGTVSVAVTAVNDPPNDYDQSATVTEDWGLWSGSAAFDPDNDPLTRRIITQAAHGIATLHSNTWNYVPDHNYFGSDSFTWVANDGLVDGRVATVTIQVTPVNDWPSGPTEYLVTNEDTALSFVPLATDPDGDPLTFAINTGPAHGSIAISGSNFVYTPSPDFSGQDYFTYIPDDGSGTAGFIPMFITVNPVNDAPTTNLQTLSTACNIPLNFVLSGSDVDNPALNFTVVTTPANGTLTGTAPNLTFTPGLNWTGTTSFTFLVNDGSLNSAVATVSITVSGPTAVPTAPSALTATTVSRSRIDLAWTDNATSESGFKIERSANGTSWSQIGTVGPNIRNYSSTGLSANKTYYYRVRAYNALGNSPYSTTAFAKTLR